jgi:hypothetical protein
MTKYFFAAVVVQLALVGGIGYVVVHFIGKFW